LKASVLKWEELIYFMSTLGFSEVRREYGMKIFDLREEEDLGDRWAGQYRIVERMREVGIK